MGLGRLTLGAAVSGGAGVPGPTLVDGTIHSTG
jgi:hypothetical protein